MYEKFKQLINNSIIYAIGTTLAALVNFILIPIYTRVFSTTVYGVLDVVLISATVIVGLSTMGLYAALSMFYFHEKNEHEKKIMISSNFIFLLSITIIICFIAAFFSKQIASIFLKNSDYSIYLIIAIATVPFTTIISFCSNLFRLAFQPIKYFYIILGNLFIGSLLAIYLVVFQKIGLFGVLYGSLISSIIFSCIGFYLTKDQFIWKFSLEKLKALIKFGLPLAPAGLMVWIINSSSRYFLAYFKTVSDIGLYSVGFKFASILLLVITPFRLANVPFQFSVSRDGGVKEIYTKTLTYYMYITLFIAVTISIFGKEFVGFLTPGEYLNAHQIIAILAFSFLIFGAYQISGIGLMLCKKTYYITYAITAGAMASILLNFLLVPALGIMGAALATLLAYLTGFCLIYYWNQKYYYIHFEIKKIVKILILSIVLILIGSILGPSPVAFKLLMKFILILVFAFIIYLILEQAEKNKLKLFINELFHKLFLKNSDV